LVQVLEEVIEGILGTCSCRSRCQSAADSDGRQPFCLREFRLRVVEVVV
jgi:hypothetical protein